MGFFSKFEGKMEDTFEGVADRIGNSPISPVQIAKKAEKQMRRGKMVGAGKQYAPTLYTVLVNPDDDHRLFGYYPTLAGETETYLSAKAAEQGLTMDGQPLVRFIVDESLKHGKFDIIAETVAAPIISQLRMEEMARYGMGISPAGFGQQGYVQQGFSQHPGAIQQPHNPAMMSSDYAPQQMYPQQVSPQQAQSYTQPPITGSASPQDYNPYAQTAYPDSSQQDSFFVDPYTNRQSSAINDHPFYEPIPNEYDGSTSFQDYSYGEMDYGNSMPLPDVPENEIDRSINYGEYTFDSQNFLDEQQQHETAFSHNSQQAQIGSPTPIGAAAGAAIDMGGIAAVGVAANNTVMFTGQPAQHQVNDGAPAAHLFNQTEQRLCNLTKPRILIGRESKNDIALRDINASRSHAELRLEPQNVWVITDLGSTNGTYVNGRRIASQPLFNGDRIDIGTTTLLFGQD